MTQSGAILKEVGTTNRTRVEDYTGAIGENTGLLFKAIPVITASLALHRKWTWER